NPALEPTAQPRVYVVEATVTGPDDQTVTNTRRVTALPPFVLGLKVPRYVEHATAVTPEVLVAGPDGSLLAGPEVTVRLLAALAPAPPGGRAHPRAPAAPRPTWPRGARASRQPPAPRSRAASSSRCRTPASTSSSSRRTISSGARRS